MAAVGKSSALSFCVYSFHKFRDEREKEMISFGKEGAEINQL
jgi:hypothetical protein